MVLPGALRGKTRREKHLERKPEECFGRVDFVMALSKPSGKGSWMCESKTKRRSLAEGVA